MITLNEQLKLNAVMTKAYSDYTRNLNSHAFFKLRNRELGEDLVQETFMKTWKYLIKNGKVDMMRAFLYHVLSGLIIDEYRKHKPTSLDVLLERGFEPSDTDNSRIVNVFDGKSATRLIRHLPLTYRKVMHMRYVQDLSITEISSMTRQSKNTVAVQTHRGLEKLRHVYNLNCASMPVA